MAVGNTPEKHFYINFVFMLSKLELFLFKSGMYGLSILKSFSFLLSNKLLCLSVSIVACSFEKFVLTLIVLAKDSISPSCIESHPA